MENKNMEKYSNMLTKAINGRPIRTKENNVGWVVYIKDRGIMEGYRGRTTYATRGAAMRAIKMALWTDYVYNCRRNDVPYDYWDDRDFEREFKKRIEDGIVKIVEVEL